MVRQIEEGGTRRLAVPLGGPARGTALSRVITLKGSPGWLVDATSIKEWRFIGVTERAGEALLYGPWVDALPLSEAVRLPLREALPLLARLADALHLLQERRVELFPVQTDAVLFTADGWTLFLPPEVMRELRGLKTFDSNISVFEALFNPDLGGEDLLSFSLAALLYRVTTGAFPFSGRTPEELHEQMRKLDIPAPRELVPGLDARLSEMVMAALGRPEGARLHRRAEAQRPPLSAWAEHLRGWAAHDPVRRVSGRETETTRAGAEMRRRASEKSFRRRVFWEKNWKTAVIIAAAAIVVGAGAASILKNVLAPRITHGYPPRKVVETFYTGTNTLDHMAMSACVVGKAGQQLINETMNLYVISRVSLGYEGRSNVVAASAWDKAGRPRLPPTQSVFGVTGLSITPEAGEPSPVFLVSYDLWTPLPGGGEPGSAPQGPRFEGHAVKDRVFMKKDRGDWVIFRIDRLQSTPLPPVQQ